MVLVAAVLGVALGSTGCAGAGMVGNAGSFLESSDGPHDSTARGLDISMLRATVRHDARVAVDLQLVSRGLPGDRVVILLDCGSPSPRLTVLPGRAPKRFSVVLSLPNGRHPGDCTVWAEAKRHGRVVDVAPDYASAKAGGLPLVIG